jgi:hypothetical protein
MGGVPDIAYFDRGVVQDCIGIVTVGLADPIDDIRSGVALHVAPHHLPAAD